MDVTPQELRDVEIRDAFRGYDRDEVDELLERAAATIEHLEHQIRILQDRLASAGGSRPAPAAAPAPAPAPVPAAPVVPAQSGDVIQRTLLLAQRAADEAVAEAQALAQQLTTDAEAKAQSLVSEAESTARRIAETERRRIEVEIAQLAASRDALTSDVDALERFAIEYRARIRRAIEAELVHLADTSSDAASGPARPALRTAGMTFAAVEAAPEPEPEPAPVRVEPESTAPVAVFPSFDDEVVEEAEEFGASWTPAPEPETWGEPAAVRPIEPAPVRRGAPEPADRGEPSLDDDAFFASLRDAVSDDEPLGPGGDFFDDEPDDDGGRGLFRRRR